MRLPALLCVWSLAGCSSVGGPLDWVIPDEFTIGQGTQDLGGTFSDGVHDFDLDGEQDSTYAALTWKIPGIERSDGMSRETQRNMALLIDKMAIEKAVIAPEDTGLAANLTLKEGAPAPPWWLPYAFGGAILLFLIVMGLKSRSNGWH